MKHGAGLSVGDVDRKRWAGARRFRLVLSCVLVVCGVIFLAPRQPAFGGERVPVVFVPGFLGSKLADDRGELWGSLSAIIKRAGDLEYGAANGYGPVRATGLVKKIRLFGPLQAIGYQPIIDLFGKLGFKQNRDLFLFPFDWRKSNFDVARELAAFVDGIPALSNRRFNLVAHSMGGVLSSIYILRHGGASRVKYFVTLGTPHLGSVNILSNLVGRFTGSFVWLRHLMGDDTFRRVLLSFPSVYEQLPSYQKSCLLFVHSVTAPRKCEILEPSFWSKFGSGSGNIRLLPRGLKDYLDGARRLRQIACARMPQGVKLFRFAGSRIRTLGRIVLQPAAIPPFNGKYIVGSRKYVAGDGRVPEYSASCGDLAGTEIIFAGHLNMLTNDILRYRMTNILLDTVMNDPFLDKPGYRSLPPATEVERRDGRKVAAPFVAFDLGSHYYRRGHRLTAEIRLRSAEGDPLSGEVFSAAVLPSGASGPAREIAADEHEPGR